jgi:hypothetical protein
VLPLVLILIVVWLGLMGFLAIGTIFLQSYINTEPVDYIQYRAPIAGTALTLFLVLWVFLDYRSPGEYGPLQSFDVSKDYYFKEFRVITQDGKEETYKPAGKNARGQVEYKLNGQPNEHKPQGRPLKVIVKENGEDVIFEPEMEPGKGKDGSAGREHFKVEKGGSLRYYDKKSGRYMQEGYFNEASKFAWGKLTVNLLLNLLHFVVWVAVLWYVLEFRFWHAFGLGIIAWGAATLLLLPPILSRTEEIARQRAARTVAAAGPRCRPPAATLPDNCAIDAKGVSQAVAPTPTSAHA